MPTRARNTAVDGSAGPVVLAAVHQRQDRDLAAVQKSGADPSVRRRVLGRVLPPARQSQGTGAVGQQRRP